MEKSFLLNSAYPLRESGLFVLLLVRVISFGFHESPEDFSKYHVKKAIDVRRDPGDEYQPAKDKREQCGADTEVEHEWIDLRKQHISAVSQSCKQDWDQHFPLEGMDLEKVIQEACPQ